MQRQPSSPAVVPAPIGFQQFNYSTESTQNPHLTQQRSDDLAQGVPESPLPRQASAPEMDDSPPPPPVPVSEPVSEPVQQFSQQPPITVVSPGARSPNQNTADNDQADVHSSDTLPLRRTKAESPSDPNKLSTVKEDRNIRVPSPIIAAQVPSAFPAVREEFDKQAKVLHSMQSIDEQSRAAPPIASMDEFEEDDDEEEETTLKTVPFTADSNDQINETEVIPTVQDQAPASPASEGEHIEDSQPASESIDQDQVPSDPMLTSSAISGADGERREIPDVAAEGGATGAGNETGDATPPTTETPTNAQLTRQRSISLDEPQATITETNKRERIPEEEDEDKVPDLPDAPTTKPEDASVKRDKMSNEEKTLRRSMAM